MALAANGPGTLDVIEMDAATHGLVDDARELRERAMFVPAQSRYKIYIIDEAHQLGPGAANALLKLIEEPPEHVRFVFATTEPDKIIGTIRSGLPSVVFVDIELAEKGGRRIARQRIVQSISYDIWQERYTIERDTLRRTLANFDSMQQASSTLHDIEMSALAQLKGQLSYVLTVQAGISPISGRQSQKFSSWLQDSDEIRSDVGSQERASGFQLNLSKLVSFLIGGDKRRGNTSPERRIEFRISELK